MFNILFLILISCSSKESNKADKRLENTTAAPSDAIAKPADANKDKLDEETKAKPNSESGTKPKADELNIELTEEEKTFIDLISANFNNKKYTGDDNSFYTSKIKPFVLDLFKKDLSKSTNRGSSVLTMILNEVGYDNLVNKSKSNLLRDLLVNYSQYIEKNITVQILGSNKRVLESKATCLNILCDYILVMKNNMVKEEFTKMKNLSDKNKNTAIIRFNELTDNLVVEGDLEKKTNKVKEVLALN